MCVNLLVRAHVDLALLVFRSWFNVTLRSLVTSISLTANSSSSLKPEILVSLTSLGPSSSCANLWADAADDAGAGAGDHGIPLLGPDPCAGEPVLIMNLRETWRRSYSALHP